MYIICANNNIVFVNIKKFLNNEELHSYIWKLKYNIEFAKKEQDILGYINGKKYV